MAIHLFTRRIHRGEPITVFGDGTSRRDYTYIADIIDGLVAAIDNCRGYHVYNLGESATIELRDLIGLIETALGKKAVIQWMPEQPGDVRVTYADIAKARAELGYHPRFPVKEGIQRFVDWYRSHHDAKA